MVPLLIYDAYMQKTNKKKHLFYVYILKSIYERTRRFLESIANVNLKHRHTLCVSTCVSAHICVTFQCSRLGFNHNEAFKEQNEEWTGC